MVCVVWETKLAKMNGGCGISVEIPEHSLTNIDYTPCCVQFLEYG